MRRSSQVALRPKNEAARPTRSQRVKRATTNYVTHDTDTDTVSILQAQHLVALVGMSLGRARLIASLHYGEAAHV